MYTLLYLVLCRRSLLLAAWASGYLRPWWGWKNLETFGLIDSLIESQTAWLIHHPRTRQLPHVTATVAISCVVGGSASRNQSS